MLWEKLSVITKSDCMIVTDLINAVTFLCLVVEVCAKWLNVFHDYCLFNMSHQKVVGIVFRCFWLTNCKNIVLRYSMTIKQFFCVEESLKFGKIGLNAKQWSLHDCKIPQKISESWQMNCVFRISSGFSPQIMEFEYKQANKMIETGVLV